MTIVLQCIDTVIGYDEQDRPHVGIYWLRDGMVAVGYLGTLPMKYADIGSSSPTGLASILLSEYMADKKLKT